MATHMQPRTTCAYILHARLQTNCMRMSILLDRKA